MAEEKKSAKKNETKEFKTPEVKFDPKRASADQIAKGLELLGKAETRKARIAAGEIKGAAGKAWGELTVEEKAKRLDYSKKLRIRQQLILRKAAAAGISVSDKEIEAAMKG